jgi:hypothetical protein
LRAGNRSPVLRQRQGYGACTLLFDAMCLFSQILLNFLFFPNISGIKITNSDGNPIAGKKFGATPKKYLTARFSPA